MKAPLLCRLVFVLLALTLCNPVLAQATDKVSTNNTATSTNKTAAGPLFQQHCASCHGNNRLGGQGPALLPQNLVRLKKPAAMLAIQNGLPASQMPAFAEQLNQQQIKALVDYIYTPIKHIPNWGETEIKNSRILYTNNKPHTDNKQPKDKKTWDKPKFTADPLNLFLIVETGDHHISILDGDKLEVIHRFKTRYALHGGPKYSPDGRYVYFASRDGWVSKFDIYNLKTTAEIRAGINTRNLALSSDGRYVLVGNYLPHSLVLLDAKDLSLIKIIKVADLKGNSSRVSAVYDAAPRQSFIVALKDIQEVWEIQYSDKPKYFGKVHDYRIEGPPEITAKFPLRRIELDDYLDDFFFDQSYDHLIGAARNNKNGQVINLHVGRKIADLDLPGMPHLGSGISWQRNKPSIGPPIRQTVIATPNFKSGELSIIDSKSWKTIKNIKTQGPGFFLRSHKNSAYAWADVFFGPNKDVVHIIDKQSLEIIKTLKPNPGKTAAHVEFDRYGKYALLSLWENDGAIIVYDAKTLKEIKRLPMSKPAGKYNVYNKINRDEGTSH